MLSLSNFLLTVAFSISLFKETSSGDVFSLCVVTFIVLTVFKTTFLYKMSSDVCLCIYA